MHGRFSASELAGNSVRKATTEKQTDNDTNKTTTRMWANLAQRDGRLPNIGATLCSTPQTLADAHY